MAKSKVGFRNKTGNRVWLAWPILSKEQALSLGWLSLIGMYWVAFFTDFKVDPVFAGSMFGFQGLDIAGKFKKKR